MAIYVYKCRDCGARLEGTDRDLNDGAVHCSTPIARDYRAEAVGFAVSKLARERKEGTDKDLARVFLETAEEAAHPGDPDGSKTIREWNETHMPKEVSESKAIRPEMPLHSKQYL